MAGNDNGTICVLRLGIRVASEHRAAESFLAKGGKVRLDCGPLGVVEIAKPEELPAWEPAVLGVDLSGIAALTDKDVGGLRGLSRLETLKLGSTKITDAAMRVIKDLASLKELQIPKTAVGDAGLEQLAGLKQLGELDLRQTPITDASLARLREAKKRAGQGKTRG